MVEKLHIGVDFDDCLVDTSNSLRVFRNDYFGLNQSPADYISYNLNEIWGMTTPEVSSLLEVYFNSLHFQTTKPIKGAQKAIHKLSSTHKLSIVTSRPLSSADVTIQYAKTMFPGAFSDFHFCNNFSEEGEQFTKAEVCNKNGIDLMIDDLISNLEDCANSEIPGILFRRTWNEMFGGGKLITPMPTWQAIEDYLL